jgi:hypothetical protein
VVVAMMMAVAMSASTPPMVMPARAAANANRPAGIAATGRRPPPTAGPVAPYGELDGFGLDLDTGGRHPAPHTEK